MTETATPYVPTLPWVLDPRVQLHLTGTGEDGAAVGWDSLRQHWCRVVHGNRCGEWHYYQRHEDAVQTAEILLADLRQERPAGIPEHARGNGR